MPLMSCHPAGPGVNPYRSMEPIDLQPRPLELPEEQPEEELPPPVDISTKFSRLPQGRPICYMCGKQVDEMITERQQRTYTTVFIVRCHGQEQAVELCEKMIQGCERISYGLAFVPGQQLTEPAPPCEHCNSYDHLSADCCCSLCDNGPHDAEKHNLALWRLGVAAGKP